MAGAAITAVAVPTVARDIMAGAATPVTAGSLLPLRAAAVAASTLSAVVPGRPHSQATLVASGAAEDLAGTQLPSAEVAEAGAVAAEATPWAAGADR
jgi:hypothetical protein